MVTIRRVYILKISLSGAQNCDAAFLPTPLPLETCRKAEGTGQRCPATSCPPYSSSWGPAARSCGARSSRARRGGVAAWRRAALEEPGLWRRVDIDVEALVSAGLRKGWGAMARTAVDRGAGRCESFSGPCDEELLLYLVERANSLKWLHLLCLDIPNEVLNVAFKKHPLLEDLELVYVNIPSEDMLKSVCLSPSHETQT
ncbi:uncharacterized protein [Miscanthus floridulus]|uniref:uncharacterized protein n=1 Tax=Miscanthus floridulus TaxID=154761 RepID=UPI0034599B1E